MNQDDIEQLRRIKKLVKEGKRRFKSRKDRDYLLDLNELRLTEEDAWKEILYLNKNFFVIDNKPFYNRDNKKLIFKKLINGMFAYIKLELIIENNEEVVCWSFHRDIGDNNEM